MLTGFRPSQESPSAEESQHSGLEETRDNAPPDLGKEAANMLKLLSRQSDCVNLLSITSKAAQAVIRQF